MGDYEIGPEDGVSDGGNKWKVDLEITDSKDHRVYHKQHADAGKFAFTSDDYDTYKICFTQTAPSMFSLVCNVSFSAGFVNLFLIWGCRNLDVSHTSSLPLLLTSLLTALSCLFPDLFLVFAFSLPWTLRFTR